MITETLRTLIKSFDTPDETKRFNRGRIEIVYLGDRGITRLELEPGWRWSQDLRPLVHVESCPIPHLQYVVSGRLMIRMDDGSRYELRPGDVASITPGHDSWVIGSEPFVAIDFSPEMRECAKKL